MKRLTVILALVTVLAACGGDTGGEGDSAEPVRGNGQDGLAVSPDTTSAAAEEGSGDDQGGTIGVNLEVPQDRKVIRQASLELQADNTRKAFDRIVVLTESAGGFIADATVHPVANEDDQPTVVMTLRIPASQLTRTMTSIKTSVEEVVSESQGAQDVTDQFIDLEARLTNLTALEVELRALLAEVRQQPEADPDELLRVFTEISNVRGQIEQIQGQLNYLEDVVSLATLEINLSPTPSVVPIVEDTWRPLDAARDAARSLVSGLQGVAEWGIHFAIFILPMLILTVGVPLLALYAVLRQWRKRRPPVEPDPALPAES